jgi:hypothetical protein
MYLSLSPSFGRYCPLHFLNFFFLSLLPLFLAFQWISELMLGEFFLPGQVRLDKQMRVFRVWVMYISTWEVRVFSKYACLSFSLKEATIAEAGERQRQ